MYPDSDVMRSKMLVKSFLLLVYNLVVVWLWSSVENICCEIVVRDTERSIWPFVSSRSGREGGGATEGAAWYRTAPDVPHNREEDWAAGLRHAALVLRPRASDWGLSQKRLSVVQSAPGPSDRRMRESCWHTDRHHGETHTETEYGCGR